MSAKVSAAAVRAERERFAVEVWNWRAELIQKREKLQRAVRALDAQIGECSAKLNATRVSEKKLEKLSARRVRP